MKLLVVSQYYWPEPFRITDICEGLKARGHEVDVLTSVPNIPEGKFYAGYGWFRHGEKEHNGIRIERVDVVQRGRDKPLRLALNCASFAFNTGYFKHQRNGNLTSMYKHLVAGKPYEACQALNLYVYANGKKSNGLVSRRALEYQRCAQEFK